jgi:hypothetical protein
MMNLADPQNLSNPVGRLFASVLVSCLLGGHAAAAEKIAVFDFEIIRSNVIPGVPENREAEEQRLRMIGERLRDHLAKSGKFELVDLGPVAGKAAAASLRACGNCADTFAGEIGATYAFTGTVQKVSELILNINVYVHEAATSQPIAASSVDLRGNTDEAWRRGIDYLYKNVLSPKLEKLFK